MSQPAKAVVLSIGEELLDGRVQDRNASFLATQLRRLGLRVVGMQTIGDQPGELIDALRKLDGQVDLVVSSGGLGPTVDDRVRDDVAQLLNQRLQDIPGAVADLQKVYQRVFDGQAAPKAFLDQGRIPARSDALANPAGTAWGFSCQLAKGTHFLAHPGPPRECRTVWNAAGKSALLAHVTDLKELAYGLFHTVSLPESHIEEKIHDLLSQGGNPRMGITAKGKQVTLSVLAHPEADRSAQQVLNDMAEVLKERLGPCLWGENDDTLEGVIVQELRQKSQTIAVAESCSGGKLAAGLTSVPGASAVFHNGWVCYSNHAKTEQLDVPSSLMDSPGCPGAVSGEVAMALAEGARKKAGADWGIGITGIAGPGGGTAGKPVGTVWIGLAGPGVAYSILRHQWTRAGRSGVQIGCTRDALEMLRRELLALPRLPERRP